VNQKLLRLILAAALFAAWMGYLSYLVYALPRPPVWSDKRIVLSQPQVLVSTVDVVGTVDVENGTVKVEDVLFPLNAAKPAKGEEIQVTNFDEVEPSVEGKTNLGSCLLLLWTGNEGKSYQFVHIPRSPGYPGGAPRIYPADGETLAEYRKIHKSKD
jgi:hypothetical protein